MFNKVLNKFVILPLICLAAFHPTLLRAEEKAAGVTSADRTDIIFTYTRQEMPEQDVAANIEVITRKQIEQMPVSNAAELLQYVTGVYVEMEGGPGATGTARIQGGDVRQTAVYQDGAPLNLLANPLTNLSSLPTSIIRRVEVYKGAASSAWGSSLGGVINIITMDPDVSRPIGAKLDSTYGEHNSLKQNGTVSGGIDQTGYLLSVTHEQSDGFVPNSAYEEKSVYAKINQQVGEASRISFAFDYCDKDDDDPVATEPTFWDDIGQNRTYERILFETEVFNGASFSIEGRHRSTSVDIDDVYSDHREKYMDYSEEIWGGGTKFTVSSGGINRFVLGSDGDWGTYTINSQPGTTHTGNWDAYANDTLVAGDYSFTVGGRYDHNQDFGSQFSPSAGIVRRFQLMDSRIKAQIGRGFSAPPSLWLDDPKYGNKDLKPETGVNYQLGLEAKPFEPLRLEMNLFRSDIVDLIRFDYETMKYQNVDEATRQGVEGSVKVQVWKGLALGFGASYVDARDEKTGEVIKDVPRLICNTSASFDYKWTTHSIVGRYIDQNSSYPETSDKVFVFDYLVKVKMPVKVFGADLGLFAAVHNLTDADYLYRNRYPQPGRWVEGGLNVEF